MGRRRPRWRSSSRRPQAPLPEKPLVLFDVDGTLFLISDPLVGRATLDAIETVYGLSLPGGAIGRVDHPGQTAQWITRLVLHDAGLDDARIDEGLAAWCDRAGARYLELLEEADPSEWEPAPGAAETLESLSGRAQVALLTGNPEPVARARMRRLGLDRFFADGQGAFGCDAEDRVELIAIARRRAGERPASETWAVGDTPRDVSGAHEAGIRCVGITSGRFGADELRDADVVVDRLSDLLRLDL